MSKSWSSEKLLQAKQVAVTQFMRVARDLSRLTVFAASARPDHNVVGVGMGYKITQGKQTTKQCIRLYVDQKIAREVIPKDCLLPPRIKGVPTDVIETGRFHVLPARTPRSQRRLRPAKPGCSIGFQFPEHQAGFVMAGTFGAVVETNKIWYILSNNHILAHENALPVGSPIFQPGLLDQGDPDHDQIAALTRFIMLTILNAKPPALLEDSQSFTVTEDLPAWFDRLKHTVRRSSMTTGTNQLTHSTWECKYHVVFTPKYRKKIL